MSAADVEAARASTSFRVLTAWLDAFNSKDESRVLQFLEKQCPDCKHDVLQRLRLRTGGLELRALDGATDSAISGVVQEKYSDSFLQFDIALEPGPVERIQKLDVNYIPRPADFPPPHLTDAELVEALRAKLEKDAPEDRFSGTVLLTKKGQVLFSAASGLADREKNIPNNLDTRFNIGSMNKMFTATAILQLVEAGKIKLSDPIGKYLPDYPNKDVATKVTIEHLLTHTGGTGDIFGPEYFEHRLELRKHDDYVKMFGARGLIFEPGSRYQYSNYGPVLLGVIIERVTGMSYFDYIARNIYKPAGMTSTGSDPIDKRLEGTAVGYTGAPGSPRKPNDATESYRGTAGGGGYSTARDLTRFAEALMANKLLNAANSKSLIAGKVDMPGSGMYAYGFMDFRPDGSGAVGHGGAAPGVNTQMYLYPDSGYVVVVLMNIDPPFALHLGRFLKLRLDHRAVDSTKRGD